MPQFSRAARSAALAGYWLPSPARSTVPPPPDECGRRHGRGSCRFRADRMSESTRSSTRISPNPPASRSSASGSWGGAWRGSNGRPESRISRMICSSITPNPMSMVCSSSSTIGVANHVHDQFLDGQIDRVSGAIGNAVSHQQLVRTRVESGEFRHVVLDGQLQDVVRRCRSRGGGYGACTPPPPWWSPTHRSSGPLRPAARPGSGRRPAASACPSSMFLKRFRPSPED